MEDRPWTKYWIAKLKADPEYSKKRFKIPPGNGWPRHLLFDPEMVDVVSYEEYVLVEEDRIALGMGCQFGIFPRIINEENSLFYNGEKLVALLSKSVLSGAVAGLYIYKIEKDDKKFMNRVANVFPNKME